MQIEIVFCVVLNRWSCSERCRSVQKQKEVWRRDRRMEVEEERQARAGVSINVSSTSWPASSRREGLQVKEEGPGRGKATSTLHWTSEEVKTVRDLWMALQRGRSQNTLPLYRRKILKVSSWATCPPEGCGELRWSLLKCSSWNPMTLIEKTNLFIFADGKEFIQWLIFQVESHSLSH